VNLRVSQNVGRCSEMQNLAHEHAQGNNIVASPYQKAT